VNGIAATFGVGSHGSFLHGQATKTNVRNRIRQVFIVHSSEVEGRAISPLAGTLTQGSSKAQTKGSGAGMGFGASILLLFMRATRFST
jgi:hypothetical protein